MTRTAEPSPDSTGRRPTPHEARPPREHRRECDLAVQQLRAIEQFTQDRAAREKVLQDVAGSREMRLDNARALDVLRRQHEAVVSRAHAHLLSSGEQLHSHTALRVVLAHRNAWFLDKIARLLRENGLVVVAQTDNGADAVGFCVAEQPDVVLVEDALLMVPGEEVVRQGRRYAPHAVFGAQAADSSGVQRLVHAGAAAAFTRQVPPADVAHSLLQLAPV